MLNRIQLLASSFALLSFIAPAAGCTSPSSGDGGTGDTGGGGVPSGGAGGAAARFFLPTGSEVDNTTAPTIEVDAQGNTHTLYPAYARGGAYYAFCGADCTGPETTKVVKFDTDGTVANAMIALDAAGHPRVLLSSYAKVYYGTCDADCGERASWKIEPIVDHGGEREISGEAFALDPKGHPRFLMHTYRAYLGIGQKEPETRYVTCEADCTTPASWTSSAIATDIWQGTHLRFDASGRARVTTATDVTSGDTTRLMAAYVECNADCTKEDSWKGAALGELFTSEYEAVSIKPTVTMALTRSGAPRVAYLGTSDAGKKQLVYMACDDDCSADHWQGLALGEHEKLSAGLDLALDGDDRPRLAYTLDYDIVLFSCDEAHCETGDPKWDLIKVEASSELKADQIFLNTNCTVGAWFFHSPSIALDPAGRPRVGYQARDISGGTSKPEPNKPGCVAGTDMTWSRLALLPSAK